MWQGVLSTAFELIDEAYHSLITGPNGCLPCCCGASPPWSVCRV